MGKVRIAQSWGILDQFQGWEDQDMMFNLMADENGNEYSVWKYIAYMRLNAC